MTSTIVQIMREALESWRADLVSQQEIHLGVIENERWYLIQQKGYPPEYRIAWRILNTCIHLKGESFG